MCQQTHFGCTIHVDYDFNLINFNVDFHFDLEVDLERDFYVDLELDLDVDLEIDFEVDFGAKMALHFARCHRATVAFHSSPCWISFASILIHCTYSPADQNRVPMSATQSTQQTIAPLSDD